MELFVSVVFPVADFRSLHPNTAGRLDKPRWGEHDPQAKFARGFGALHTRTKSGAGFLGENYYADCENLVKYPSQTIVSALVGETSSILSYPIYRRFYFDGQMSGRFEFGFRLDEHSIDKLLLAATFNKTNIDFDPIEVIRQVLAKTIVMNIPDGRRMDLNFLNAASALRDSYLISSTKNDKLNQYDISSVGVNYVAVGAPFAFLRAGLETPLVKPIGHRHLFSSDYEMYSAPSGHQGRSIDSVVLKSSKSLGYETLQERFARLVYTQLRALSFAHSFYLKQADANKIVGSSPLEPAISSMLERLKNLSPIEGDPRDAELCLAMAEIIENSDISPERLAVEIDKRFKRGFFRRCFPNIFRLLDKKSDVAIEAAVSTATRYALNGGP